MDLTVSAVPETPPHDLHSQLTGGERTHPWLKSPVLIYYHTTIEGSVNSNLLG